jgi:ribose transport system permease protein
MSTLAESIDSVAGPDPATPPQRSTRARARAFLAFGNISALYVFALIFVVFSLWIPETFLSWPTWRAMLDNQAITAIAAIGLLLPLSAGAFNLAIGLQVGFGSILVAWLLIDAGLPVVSAMVLTLLAGAAIGAVSGLLVVKARIDSFIATLGVSSLLAASITIVSNGEQLLGAPPGFVRIGTGSAFGVTYPVLFVVLIALVVWYVLERTPIGRRIYATGGNPEAARLAGVRTGAVVIGTLVACGAIAAFAGILVTARLGNADPVIGPGYLLPAFTAAFLGSTQFRGGRFNVLGTVVAVYVLAAGVKGLQLAGAPVWIPDAFNGTALLVAVALAKYQTDASRTSAIRRLLRLTPHRHGTA